MLKHNSLRVGVQQNILYVRRKREKEITTASYRHGKSICESVSTTPNSFKQPLDHDKDRFNPLTAGVAYIRVFIIISTLSATF